MQSGNIKPKETIRMDYLGCSTVPFKLTPFDKRIIIRPHQAKSIENPDMKYHPPKLNCQIEEIDCVCVKRGVKGLNDIVSPLKIERTMLWLDPRLLGTECLASFIINWKKHVMPNVALGIIVPDGCVNQKTDLTYEIWKAEDSGPIYGGSPKESIWYPSLARDSSSLLHAMQKLDPYDIFPLIEFSDTAIELTDSAIINHTHARRAGIANKKLHLSRHSTPRSRF